MRTKNTMKLGICTLLLTILSGATAFANSDSVYYLIVGKKKCPLILHEKLDSTYVVVAPFPNPTEPFLNALKDKPWNYHQFIPGTLDTTPLVNPITLEVEGDFFITKDTIKLARQLKGKPISKETSVYLRKTVRVDTVMDIDPLTLAEEQVVITHHKFDIKNDLGDVDFKLFFEQIKTGFRIEGKGRVLHAREMWFYYETESDCGWITLNYPNPDTMLLKKLAALKDGGFVCLWSIVVQEEFLTEPVFLETYFSVNNAVARPEATKNLAVIKRLPYSPYQAFIDSGIPFPYEASMGLLYVGIPNRIILSIPGVLPSSIHAIPEGRISVLQNATDPRVFNVTANYSYAPAVIRYVQVINGDSTEVRRDSFHLMRLPDPRLTLNGKLWSGRVDKTSLQAMSGVVPLLFGYYIPARFTVEEMYMIYSNKGKISTSYTKGPLFSPEMMQWINQSQPSDIFIIGTSKLVGPDGMDFHPPAMYFIIDRE